MLPVGWLSTRTFSEFGKAAVGKYTGRSLWKTSMSLSMNTQKMIMSICQTSNTRPTEHLMMHAGKLDTGQQLMKVTTKHRQSYYSTQAIVLVKNAEFQTNWFHTETNHLENKTCFNQPNTQFGESSALLTQILTSLSTYNRKSYKHSHVPCMHLIEQNPYLASVILGLQETAYCRESHMSSLVTGVACKTGFTKPRKITPWEPSQKTQAYFPWRVRGEIMARVKWHTPEVQWHKKGRCDVV